MSGDNGSVVSYEVVDAVAFITLNNPPVNIMTQVMMDEIADCLDKATDDKTLKAVVFKAEGKAFSAGADIGEHEPERAEGMITSFGRMFQLFEALPLPVVMAVQGAALGAGFELVLMADILLAAEEATFGQPEIRLGFFAPLGIVVLPELVGRAKAMEITCTGKIYSAQEMRDYDLVSKVLPAAGLDEAVAAILKDLRRASPLVMRMNAHTLKRLRGRPFSEAFDEANRVFLEELMATEDPREGIAAFYEKRKPDWKNR
jgi:cyclohexa-1,5-dienecarbonyl-CoA hydratase